MVQSFLHAHKLIVGRYWPALKYKKVIDVKYPRRLFEISLALIVGLIAGILWVFSWGLGSSWQGLILVIPIGFTFVMLSNNLERLVLAVIAISIPLNLDVSLIISPYARNPENIAAGHRTLVTLTELRLSLVMVLLVVGYALWIISDRKSMKLYPATTIPALIFLFLSFLSMFQAQDWQLSFFRIIQLLEVFLMYFYVVNHIRNIGDMRFFLTVLLAGMLAESILMVVQWNTGLEFIIAGVEASFGGGRVSGTIGNAGPAGGYLSVMLLIAIAGLWAFPRSLQISLAFACIVTGFPAMISTASRASWSGFAVAFLIFITVAFWRNWIPRKSIMVLVFAVVILGLIFYLPIHTRLTEDDGGSAESRPRMYRLAWNVIRPNMWFGVGTNNYALVAKDYYTADVGDLGYVVNSIVHNKYLAIWAETGLFGLISFLVFLIAPLLQLLKYILKPQNKFINLIALGVGCGMISIYIQMFTGTFHMRAIVFLIWLLPAVMASLQNFERPQYQSVQKETSQNAHHLTTHANPLHLTV